MRDDDARRVPSSGWLDFLAGKNPDYPEVALRRDLADIRSRIAAMRKDETTPDTRLADDPMKFNPCSVASLLELSLGGVHPGRGGNALICRLRYFDPAERRAGLPEDVAALVERLTAEEATVTLVNVNQIATRKVVVQGGAYAEHEITAVKVGNRETAVGRSAFQVTLAPGAGSQLTIRFRRYARAPTLTFPWD